MHLGYENPSDANRTPQAIQSRINKSKKYMSSIDSVIDTTTNKKSEANTLAETAIAQNSPIENLTSSMQDNNNPVVAINSPSSGSVGINNMDLFISPDILFMRLNEGIRIS